MKKLIFLLPLFLLTLVMAAQPEHRVAIDGRTVVFEEIDNLVIVGYDGKDLKIGRQDEKNNGADDRAKGLRKISAAGKTDNTGFGLNSRREGDEVVISQVGRGDGTIMVQVPNSAVVRVEQSTYKGGDLVVSNFNGELDVSMHYHHVKLTNSYGPLSINTIYGGIEASFSAGPPSKAIRLHSTYGDVDVTLPGNTKASLWLKTSYGDMYTDFDIEVEANMDKEFNPEEHDHDKDHGHCHDECKHGKSDSGGLTGSINGGGEMITMTASYKNIYIRKL